MVSEEFTVRGNLLPVEILISIATEIQNVSSLSLRGSPKDFSMGFLPDGHWLLDTFDAKSPEETEAENRR